MTFQSIPEAIPIGIAAVLSGTLAVFAWRRRSMPMAPAFADMMAGETAWALGAALEPMHRRATHQAPLHRPAAPRYGHRDTGTAGFCPPLHGPFPLAEG